MNRPSGQEAGGRSSRELLVVYCVHKVESVPDGALRIVQIPSALG